MSFCFGTSGGVGGGVSGARMLHVAGHSAVLVRLKRKTFEMRILSALFPHPSKLT